MSRIFFILIITSYVALGQSHSKPELFDPETGDLIKIEYNPETGEIIRNKTEVKRSLVNNDISNSGYDKKISYSEIKRIAKNDAKIYINKNPWIAAGVLGCGPGLILGPMGLGIPATYGYFKSVIITKVPENVPHNKVNLYKKNLIKEIKVQRGLAILKGHGIGLLVFIFIIMGSS